MGLAAAALLPEGMLRGVAVEADPMAAKVLQDSMKINNLDGKSLENSSRVDVRSVVVSNRSRKAVRMGRGHEGLYLHSDQPDRRPQASDGHEVLRNAITLDSLLSDLTQDIDLLQINPIGP